jgi:ABC-type glycerol-3-phosphate transport system permease component
MRTNWVKSTLAYLFLTVLAVLALLPIVLSALTAFKPKVIWVASPPVWIFTPTLENFKFILLSEGHLQNLISSLIISIGTVSIALLVGVPAAYAFARFRFTASQFLLSWLISLRMIPPVVVGIPFYALFYRAGLRNTHLGLILAYLSFSIPLAIWIMRGYFADLPSALEESAMVDGCGRLEALRRVVLPVVAPGIMATGLLVFIFAWSEYLLAVMLSSRETATLPIAAATYVGLAEVAWGNVFAINLVIMVPVMILALVLQHQLLRGLTFGLIE